MNPNSMIFEKYRQSISIFQTLLATMGTTTREEGLSGRRQGFAAFWGRAFQRAGATACRTTLQWSAIMGTVARGLLLAGQRSSDRRQWEQSRGCWEEKKRKKKKRLSLTVLRKPTGSFGSAVWSPVQLVRFWLNLFAGQLAGPDRNGDQSTVESAGLVWFLKHWKNDKIMVTMVYCHC